MTQDAEESGAEWLARENQRLTKRVRELEDQRDKLAAEVAKLTDERDVLSSKFWRLKCDIEEALERILREGRG